MSFRSFAMLAPLLLAAACAPGTSFVPNAGGSNATPASSYLPRGVYAFILPAGAAPPADVVENPNVTGLHVRALWKQIEPADHQFDWSYFDDVVAQARVTRKRVSMAVIGGVHDGVFPNSDGLPPWLDPAVAMFDCSDGSRGPVPWDVRYRQEWRELWVALAQRYEAEPVVSAYHIGGIYSWNTGDWDLCDATSADRDAWLAIGYHPDRIRESALSFAASLAATTTKPFILPVAGTMGAMGGPRMDVTVNYVIDPLYAAYGPSSPTPRFGIMRTTFLPTTSDPLGVWNTNPLTEQYQVLYERRPHTAGQQHVGPPLGDDDVVRMADISLHYQIQYMELRLPELRQLTALGMLHCYDRGLGSEGAHCGHE